MRVAKGTSHCNFSKFTRSVLVVFLTSPPAAVRLRTPLCGVEQSVQEE